MGTMNDIFTTIAADIQETIERIMRELEIARKQLIELEQSGD